MTKLTISVIVETIDTVMVHGGLFHADDVFCVALMQLIKPSISYTRTFRVPDEVPSGTLVADIGGLYDGVRFFDHHQADAPTRETGEKYCAFGQLWECLGADFLGDEGAAIAFDRSVVLPIDITDNTGESNPLSLAISAFNPCWDSEESSDDAFENAVDFAKGILKRAKESAESKKRAESIVQKALEEMIDEVVILPCFAPWQSILIPSDAKFVVFPSNRGGFNAQVVPRELGKQEAKLDFPAEWAGLRDTELQSVSGIGTMTFCHIGKFMLSCEELDDCIIACQKTLRKEEEKDPCSHCCDGGYAGCLGSNCIGCTYNPKNLH